MSEHDCYDGVVTVVQRKGVKKPSATHLNDCTTDRLTRLHHPEGTQYRFAAFIMTILNQGKTTPRPNVQHDSNARTTIVDYMLTIVVRTYVGYVP